MVSYIYGQSPISKPKHTTRKTKHMTQFKESLTSQEIAQELYDVLNDCDECFGTLNQHMLMCSNKAHQAIAYILSNWEYEDMPEWERDEYECKVNDLEEEVWTLQSDVDSRERDIDELTEKLKEYSHLNIEDLKREVRGLKATVERKDEELEEMHNKLKVWSAIDPKEVRSNPWR